MSTLNHRHKISMPQPLSNKVNIILFDWDDTLLCSSFLNPYLHLLDYQQKTKNTETSLQLAKLQHSLGPLAERIIHLLTIASKHAHTQVHIVTNATVHIWPRYTTKAFIPSVLPHLSNIHIVSSRQKFEKVYPLDCDTDDLEIFTKWKYYTFNEIVKPFVFNQSNHINLLCFGDSDVEIKAVKQLSHNLSNVTLKTIKFVPRPTLTQLIEEIDTVLEHWNEIFSTPTATDFTLPIIM